MKFSSIFVIFSLIFYVTSAKRTLISEGAFDGDEERSSASIERNRASEERINLSFPGTKWCGPGNTASGYDDLGSDEEVDKCCRAHDHCDNMASGEEKHGLKNDDFFTRLHCICDKEFKQCLKTVNSRRGNYIGNFYFDVRNKCYKDQHPVVECDQIHTKIFIRRCIKYAVDAMLPRKWQWFDLPFYDDEHDFNFVDGDDSGKNDEMEFVKELKKIGGNFV